jgi:hypothetical protein
MATHEYSKDPDSGAGNCRCGQSKESLAHPHKFTAARADDALCVCSKPRSADVHTGG